MEQLGNIEGFIGIWEEIAKHCSTETLTNLIEVNRSTYKNRLIFIKQMTLCHNASKRVLKKKPFGWNQVHSLWLSCQRITDDDLSLLSQIHAIDLSQVYGPVLNI